MEEVFVADGEKAVAEERRMADKLTKRSLPWVVFIIIIIIINVVAAVAVVVYILSRNERNCGAPHIFFS
jgi:t-SNARE complex subunit (syntaxin)